MKLWIISDLHFDVNARHPFVFPDPRPAHDVVVIAGDIMAGMADAVRWIVRQGLNERPVVYVGGNHEFYGHDRHGGLQEVTGRSRTASEHPHPGALLALHRRRDVCRLHALDRFTSCSAMPTATRSMRPML